MDSSTIPTCSGIYRITCIPTGKFYIGSAIDLYDRWHTHLYRLRHNIKTNPKLQAAFNKYGEQAFRFDVLEIVLVPEMLTAREQYYLDTLNPFGKRGFNIATVADSRLGTTMPPEAIEKIRQFNQGRKYPPEFGEKITQRQLGQKYSPERCKNISKGQRGRVAPNRGKPMPREAVEKRRQKMLGYKQTEEHIRNAAATRLGKHRSLETRKRMSASAMGHAPTNAKTFILTSPDGIEYTVHNLLAFCREHGLNSSTLTQVAKGKRKQHKGWTARYPDLTG